ncbi:allantoate permease [[Candida] jaroonii]|uniref:Allantoate permease n=1 Tax=[Candida] jaroonii TaxID=467808 RepID=A0ACA9Y4A9_9ASCO|nr:allantoate permease [[Candida] jaroonii]
MSAEVVKSSSNSIHSEKDKAVEVITHVKSIEALTDDKIQINGKVIKLDGGDQIMKLGLADDDEIELTPEVEKRLRRKSDMYLLPIMLTLYCLQFMDKLSNSFSSILGLRAELNMNGQIYSWTGSAFYLGYLFAEFFMSYALQKLPLAKTLSGLVIVWGVILALHSVANTNGFLALRVLLGMFESSITPGFSMITRQWYRKEETFFRTSIWFSGNGVGIILGSLMAYGIDIHRDSMSIEPWKLVFIISGVLTIAFGIVMFFHLPDSPAQAWFLTDLEKKLIVQRIKGNHQGFGNHHIKKEQVIEALTDYRSWIIFASTFVGSIPNGGLTNFGSILMNETFGYSVQQSLLLQTIGGAVEFVGLIFIASFSVYIKSRFLWAFVGQCIAVTGMFLLCFAEDKTVRFAGNCLISVSPLSFIVMLSTVQTNILGSTKQSTVFIMLLVGYCIGNLAGSQTFLATEAPVYRTALNSIAACAALSLVLLVALWASYAWENKKRDKRGDKLEVENVEFLDLTDKQNLNFRYSY